VFGWLAERERAGRDDPFFLYVHYMDPHTPYAPPPGFDEDLFVGDELYGQYAHLDVPIGEGYVGMLDEHLVLEGGSHEIDLYVARYDAEIAYCDREIGRLIDSMRARGWLDESLLVVTADHGESMTEHGVYFNHGLFPYENNIRVPLIVRHPAFEAGRRVADVVQSIDLAPTLLDASGLDLPDAIEGETILPLLLGQGGKSLDLAFAEAGESHGGSLITALRTRESKLIAFRRRAPTWYEEGMGIVGVLREAAFDPGRFYDFMAAFELEGDREHERELYDIAADPDEEVNLVEERPEDVRALSERLEPFREAAFELRPDTRIDESEMDAETLETLKSLGYVQ
jgi:arylsulfatase A-like enzyme